MSLDFLEVAEGRIDWFPEASLTVWRDASVARLVILITMFDRTAPLLAAAVPRG
jgi:hypothetical protein